MKQRTARLHEVGSVAVDDGAECHSVSEASRHVGDVHVSVALRDVLRPLQEPFQPRVARHHRCNSE